MTVPTVEAVIASVRDARHALDLVGGRADQVGQAPPETLAMRDLDADRAAMTGHLARVRAARQALDSQHAALRAGLAAAGIPLDDRVRIAGLAQPAKLAALTCHTARQAIDQLESDTGELAYAIVNLTSPDVIAQEGNLGWYRHQVEGGLVRLRQALRAASEQHARLEGFLAGQGAAG